MECNQMREMISAYVDGELDAAQRKEAERHLVNCAGCSQVFQSISALTTAMRDDTLLYNVPGALRKKIESLVNKAADPSGHAKPRPSRFVHPIRYIAISAAAALAVAAGITTYFVWPTAQQRIEKEAVQDHQRSLTANHLIDFASSDPQAVVHWLASKLSFTPLAPNSLPAGYTLVGGRVDALAGQRVAVLVYRSGSQTSNVFQYPLSGAAAGASTHSINGLGVSSWQGGGMNFDVVSDGGPAQAQQISGLFISQGCGER
jgi:anti-sigma factor RsiW